MKAGAVGGVVGVTPTTMRRVSLSVALASRGRMFDGSGGGVSAAIDIAPVNQTMEGHEPSGASERGGEKIDLSGRGRRCAGVAPPRRAQAGAVVGVVMRKALVSRWTRPKACATAAMSRLAALALSGSFPAS